MRVPLNADADTVKDLNADAVPFDNADAVP